jgi:hypothetical protein
MRAIGPGRPHRPNHAKERPLFGGNRPTCGHPHLRGILQPILSLEIKEQQSHIARRNAADP